MIDLTSTGIIVLVSSAFTSGAHWALSYYKGSRNSNGTRAMHNWQEQKDREILALQIAIQANAVSIAALDGVIRVGVLPRLEIMERK